MLRVKNAFARKEDALCRVDHRHAQIGGHDHGAQILAAAGGIIPVGSALQTLFNGGKFRAQIQIDVQFAQNSVVAIADLHKNFRKILTASGRVAAAVQHIRNLGIRVVSLSGRGNYDIAPAFIGADNLRYLSELLCIGQRAAAELHGFDHDKLSSGSISIAFVLLKQWHLPTQIISYRNSSSMSIFPGEKSESMRRKRDFAK